jgi:hypothetical protein
MPKERMPENALEIFSIFINILIPEYDLFFKENKFFLTMISNIGSVVNLISGLIA